MAGVLLRSYFFQAAIGERRMRLSRLFRKTFWRKWTLRLHMLQAFHYYELDAKKNDDFAAESDEKQEETEKLSPELLKSGARKS